MSGTASEERGIRVRDLAKVFAGPDGDVVAVAGIGFEVRPGEIFGLLGPNGAGKTTTLRMIATLLSPTTGEVRVEGLDARTQAGEVRRRIGFQTGSTGVYERLTPVEMMAFFGRLQGMSEERIAGRTRELVERFRMADFADRLCGRLSTGQKQKVSIARTVIHDPPVLIFDEPTSGLDVIVGRTVLDFILAAREAQKTVIFSTHHMPMAEELCDRVAILYDGRILAEGRVREVCERAGQAGLEAAFFAVTGEYDRKKAAGGGTTGGAEPPPSHGAAA